MNILKLQNNPKHKNKLKETPKVVLKCASPYNGLDVQLPPARNPFASFQGGALLMLCICGLLTLITLVWGLQLIMGMRADVI